MERDISGTCDGLKIMLSDYSSVTKLEGGSKRCDGAGVTAAENPGNPRETQSAVAATEPEVSAALRSTYALAPGRPPH
jgi:hypothetical protein